MELLGELRRLIPILSAAGVPWGVAAGAAVYLYTGKRPPTDLDILVPPDGLPAVGRVIGLDPESHEGPWGDSFKLQTGDVEIVGQLTIRIGAGEYPYFMDSEMVGRLRTLALDELAVPVLAPEELIAMKAVMQRGPDQGKHDLDDLAALAEAVEVDKLYLGHRLTRMGARERAWPVLERLGWGDAL